MINLRNQFWWVMGSLFDLPFDALLGCYAMGVVARAVVERGREIESLRGRMGESTREVEGLFESLLAQSFDGGR